MLRKMTLMIADWEKELRTAWSAEVELRWSEGQSMMGETGWGEVCLSENEKKNICFCCHLLLEFFFFI